MAKRVQLTDKKGNPISPINTADECYVTKQKTVRGMLEQLKNMISNLISLPTVPGDAETEDTVIIDDKVSAALSNDVKSKIICNGYNVTITMYDMNLTLEDDLGQYIGKIPEKYIPLSEGEYGLSCVPSYYDDILINIWGDYFPFERNIYISNLSGSPVTIDEITFTYPLKTPFLPAEMADLRVGADGTVYPSAGEAIRQQVSQLSEEKISKPSSDGTEGQVLSRDAEGNIVWKDADITNFVSEEQNVFQLRKSGNKWVVSTSELSWSEIKELLSGTCYLHRVSTDSFAYWGTPVFRFQYTDSGYGNHVSNMSSTVPLTLLQKITNSEGIDEGLYSFDFDALKNAYDEWYETIPSDNKGISNPIIYCDASRLGNLIIVKNEPKYGDGYISYDNTSKTVNTEFADAVKMVVEDSSATEIEPDFSPLAGKYGLHIGDSYTYAMAGSSGAFTALDTSLGMAGALNYGIVSSTIRDSDGTGYANKPMVCRVLNEGSMDTSGSTIVGDYVPMDRTDIGYITFMGGTNDSYGIESSVGTDIMDGNRAHIYGAMNLILQKLVENYPDVPIIVILQPPCANLDTDTSPEGADVSELSQYLNSVYKSQRKQKAVKEVTEVFANAYDNVHLVDCCFNWHSPMNSDELAKYWNSDLLHLTGAGYSEITKGQKYNCVYKVLAEIFS